MAVVEIPLAFRLALSGAVFIVGSVKIYQFLTPARSLAVLPLPEQQKRLARLESAPIPLVWATAVTTLLLSLAALLPGQMLGRLEALSDLLRQAAVALLGPAYPAGSAGTTGAIGPVPMNPPHWLLAAGLAAAFSPLALWWAWRLRPKRPRSGRLVALGGMCVLCVGGIGGSAAVRDLTGATYRGALKQWARRVAPLAPEEAVGGEGPVVVYARPTFCREVEPGILYRRKMQVDEYGLVVPSEEIYPFHAGRMVVLARPGENLMVAGVAPAYEGVIVTQEPLRIAGYLSGRALEAKHGIKLYIAPADYRAWRYDLERLWGGLRMPQRLLPPVYMMWLLLAFLWGLGIVAESMIRSLRPSVYNVAQSAGAQDER